MNWKLHFNLGVTLLELQRPGEAVPVLERARDLAPEREAVWKNLAAAYLYAGRFGEARDAYVTLLANWPDNPETRATRDRIERILRENR